MVLFFVSVFDVFLLLVVLRDDFGRGKVPVGFLAAVPTGVPLERVPLPLAAVGFVLLTSILEFVWRGTRCDGTVDFGRTGARTGAVLGLVVGTLALPGRPE